MKVKHAFYIGSFCLGVGTPSLGIGAISSIFLTITVVIWMAIFVNGKWENKMG